MSEKDIQPELDELDTWFEDVDEEEEVPSAEDEDEEEETSTDYPYDASPEDEDPSEDAEESASDEGTSTEEPKQDGDDPYAWIAALEPAVREKVERLAHSERSQKGRVAAYSRQLDEMRAGQEAAARVAQKESAPKQQGAVPDGEKPIEEWDDEEIAAFREEFPSVAANIEKMLALREKKIREEVLSEVRPLRQQAETERLLRDREELRNVASQIFNTAETGIGLDEVTQSDAFRDWLQAQPEGYRTYAMRAQRVDEAAKVLEDFARYTDEQVWSAFNQEQERIRREQERAEKETADKTAARRKQARQGTHPSSRSAAKDVGDGRSSYERYFDEAVEAGR